MASYDHVKLAELARAQNTAATPPIAKLRQLTALDVPDFTTPNCEQSAEQWLREGKPSGFFKKATSLGRNTSVEIKITAAAIPKAVDSNEPAGVIQALLSRGQHGDKVQSKLENWDELLLKAANASNADLVWLLASRASLQGKNEALAAALTKRDPNTIRKLLEYNANPNYCCSQFLEAAAKADRFIINNLLSAPTQLKQELLIKALLPVVRVRCLQTLQLIVSAIDRGSLQEVGAIVEAANSGQVGAVLTLLLSTTSIPFEDLDQLVLNVFNNPAVDSASLTTILHALFYAGAAGPRSSAAMCTAVEKHSLPLVRLFAEHRVDINWASGVIVRRAVATGRSDLLCMVLNSGSLSSENASEAVKALPQNLPSPERFELLRILIDAGAHGEPVEKELTLASKNNDRNLVVFLRSKGVSIDTNQGDALVAAILNENIEIVGDLLRGPAAQFSLQTAFSYILSVRKSARLSLTRLLVEAKVDGHVIDVALRDAVCDGSLDRDPSLIHVLLEAGGNPVFDDSKSIRYTIMQEDSGLFEALLKSRTKVSEGVITSLVPDMLNVRDRKARLSMIRCSLATHPKGNSVTEALLAVIEEDKIDMPLLELIVQDGRVDINYKQGIILIKGVCAGKSVLEQLMRINDRTRATTTAALVKLLELKVYDDEAKAARAAILLSSGRTSDTATQGMICYIEYLKASGSKGEEWPMQTFNVLLNAGANINLCKTVLPDVAKAAAKRLLQILLTQKPGVALLDSALGEAVKIKRRSQVDIVQMILDTGPSEDSISSALIQASRTNLGDTCSMLLKYSPSLSFNSFAAIRYAATSTNINLLKTFLDSKPSREAIDATFEEAKNISDAEQKLQVMQALLGVGVQRKLLNEYLIDQVGQGGQRNITQTLLEHQADVHYMQNKSLVLASLHGNLDVLQMLFVKATEKSSSATHCFNELVLNNQIRQDRILVLIFLLDAGAHGNSVNTALQQAIRNLPSQPGLYSLFEILLSHGADVNYEQGDALCHACEKTGPGIVAIFMKWHPSVKVRSRALHFLLGSAASESDFCQILDLLMNTETPSPGTPEFCTSHGGFDEPLRVLLCKRPNGVVELKQILKYQPQILSQPANKSILSWAMAQTSVSINNTCLALLIRNGANVNHRNPQTGESILLQAIQCQRSELVGVILAHGADITVPDNNGTSPLLLASMLGDQLTVANLLKMDAPKNDGSLHHAVRGLQSQVVETLLKHGHDPNYPSPQYQGRSPLAEMLYSGQAGRQDHSTVEKVIHLMRDHGADTRRLVSRKPLICWALDNEHNPVYMVQPLLSAHLYKEIDEDYNLYDNRKYIYSPTMYVAKGEFTGPKDRADELVLLLRNSGANRDVYYSLTGTQPEDAQGMPEELAKIEHVRRAKQVMRKEDEEDVARRRRLEDEDFERGKMREEARTQQLIKNRRLMEDEDARIQQAKSRAAIVLHSNEEAARQREMSNRHTLQLQMSRDLADGERQMLLENSDIQQREREKDFRHRTAVNDLEVETTRRRLVLEDESQSKRAIVAHKALEAQVKLQKELVSSQDVQNEKAHNMRMAQLRMETAMPVGVARTRSVAGGGYIEN